MVSRSLPSAGGHAQRVAGLDETGQSWSVESSSKTGGGRGASSARQTLSPDASQAKMKESEKIMKSSDLEGDSVPPHTPPCLTQPADSIMYPQGQRLLSVCLSICARARNSTR